jgi:hypothetical protein
MKKLDGMGIKPPSEWKDKIYKHEIIKLDVIEALRKRGDVKVGKKDYTEIYPHEGEPIKFNFGSYFDKSIAKNFNLL